MPGVLAALEVFQNHLGPRPAEVPGVQAILEQRHPWNQLASLPQH